MAPIPLAKLAGLLIKTLAKPVSKEIKRQFVKRPLTRRSLISVGQASHAVMTRMTIWSSGYKVRSVPKIEDDVALSQGAELLGETVLFAASAGLVVYEYNRSSAKEQQREEARLQAIRDDAARLQAKLVSLDKRLVALEEYAKKNRLSILGIEVGATGEYVAPGEVVPIADEESNAKAVVLGDRTRTQPQQDSPTVQTSTKDLRRWWPF